MTATSLKFLHFYSLLLIFPVIFGCVGCVFRFGSFLSEAHLNCLRHRPPSYEQRSFKARLFVQVEPKLRSRLGDFSLESPNIVILLRLSSLEL